MLCCRFTMVTRVFTVGFPQADVYMFVLCGRLLFPHNLGELAALDVLGPQGLQAVSVRHVPCKRWPLWQRAPNVPYTTHRPQSQPYSRKVRGYPANLAAPYTAYHHETDEYPETVPVAESPPLLPAYLQGVRQAVRLLFVCQPAASCGSHGFFRIISKAMRVSARRTLCSSIISAICWDMIKALSLTQ